MTGDPPSGTWLATDAAVGDDIRPRRPRVRRALTIVGGVALLLAGVAVGTVLAPAGPERSGVPGAGSVDVGFAQDMQVHLSQAVTMATVAQERSADPAVKALAFSIDGAFLKQIGMLTGWLDLWGQSLFPEPGGQRAWPTDARTATPADLARLRSLSGRDFDVWFLQLMVRHHQGGLPMAGYAAQHAGQGVVRTLADKIVTSEGDEVAVMTSMLAERGAQPLAAPH